jgi:hypothetical protein
MRRAILAALLTLTTETALGKIPTGRCAGLEHRSTCGKPLCAVLLRIEPAPIIAKPLHHRTVYCRRRPGVIPPATAR